MRLRNAEPESGVGDGGDAGGGWPGEARGREDVVTDPELTDRDMVPETILDLGGDRIVGEVPRTLPMDVLAVNGGDTSCLPVGDNARAACDVLVAWWRRDGGAAAFALALARVAAIAAATLLFLVLGVSATVGATARLLGLGHALSSCFLAIESKASRITAPLSGHMPSKTQNIFRASSRTLGFGSPRVFFSAFSSNSTPPLDSIACFARIP